MNKSMIEHHIDMSKDKLFKMLDELYEIPSDKWDDCETDMMRDIWQALEHMCNVKAKMQ